MRKLTVLTILCVFLLAPLTAFADSITPDTFSTTLAVGESVTIRKVVTIDEEPPVTAPVDVLFLADTTGSMGSAIADVKAGAAAIMADVAGLGDVQFAVAEYKDIYDSYSWRTNSALTNSTATAQAGINMWAASGGDDTPEGQMIALTELATDPGEVGWRDGSTRILVWFGDAPGHDPRDGYTEAGATAALVAANISVEALSTGYNQLNSTGQAARIAAATGGNFYSGIDNDAVAAAITAAITSSIDEYSTVELAVIGDPGGVGVAITPADGYTGDYDRSEARDFVFDVTFTGEEEGDYIFDIGAYVDGGLVAVEKDRITVTDVPEPGTLLLLSTGLLGLVGLARRKNS